MYEIKSETFGYRLTFGDFIKAPEMQQWVDDSEKALRTAPPKFGVIIDMRTVKPIPAESMPLMEQGQKMYKGKGMERSCVILANAAIALQFKRIAKETGIYQWERYLDASAVDDWETVARSWVVSGTDPDA